MPCARSSASSTASSREAFAMGWPLTGASAGHAFAPALRDVGGHPDAQDVPLVLDPEGGPEGCDQRQPDAPELDLLQLHRRSPVPWAGRSSTYQPDRVMPVAAMPRPSASPMVARSARRHREARSGSAARTATMSLGTLTSSAPPPATGDLGTAGGGPAAAGTGGPGAGRPRAPPRGRSAP